MTSRKNGRIACFENVPTFGRRTKSAQGRSQYYQSIDCNDISLIRHDKWEIFNNRLVFKNSIYGYLP